jgi:hypothetical protein
MSNRVLEGIKPPVQDVFIGSFRKGGIVALSADFPLDLPTFRCDPVNLVERFAWNSPRVHLLDWVQA